MFKNAYNQVCYFVKKQKKAVVTLGLTAVTALTVTAPAHAVALLDLTTAATAITGELTPAITAGMPIFGTILAVGVGIKFFKRFVH